MKKDQSETTLKIANIGGHLYRYDQMSVDRLQYAGSFEFEYLGYGHVHSIDSIEQSECFGHFFRRVLKARL